MAFGLWTEGSIVKVYLMIKGMEAAVFDVTEDSVPIKKGEAFDAKEILFESKIFISSSYFPNTIWWFFSFFGYSSKNSWILLDTVVVVGSFFISFHSMGRSVISYITTELSECNICQVKKFLPALCTAGNFPAWLHDSRNLMKLNHLGRLTWLLDL